LYKIDRAGPVYFQFEQWAEMPGLTHAVFSRNGGASRAPWASLNMGGTVGDDPDAVMRNMHMAFNALELDMQRACTVWQVHSADSVLASEPVP